MAAVAILTFGLQARTCAQVIVTFESIAPGVPISNQFAGLGLVFGPGLYSDPFPASSINGTREATNFTSVANITNPIIASFATVQFHVEFFAAGDGGGGSLFEVRAFAGAIQVDQQLFTTGSILPGGTLPSVTAILDVPVGFDRLEITRTDGNGSFSVDNLSFVPAPEPSGLFLLAIAAAGAVGKSLWRRRRTRLAENA